MSSSGPFFSILLSCCDVEPYLEAAIDSVLEQDFEDFECILVVEASRDRTAEICRRYTAMDPRVQMAEEPRSGSPSMPRNTGLELSRGKYVYFLDGDDRLLPGVLTALAAAIRNHDYPEIVQGSLEVWQDHPDGTRTFTKRIFNYGPEDSGKIFRGSDAIVRQISRTLYPIACAGFSVCRLDYLRQHGLWFVPGLIHEDEEWTPRAMFLASRLLVLDLALYDYRQRANSIMSQSKVPNVVMYARVMRRRLGFSAAHESEVPEALWQAWQRNWLSLLFFMLFYPKEPSKCPTDTSRRAALIELLQGDSRKTFRQFIRRASSPKRIGMRLMLACTVFPGTALLWPCDLFFRMMYYPLVTVRDGKQEFSRK